MRVGPPARVAAKQPESEVPPVGLNGTPMREDVRRALAIHRNASLEERTIDITTTGRRSGDLRRIEIVFYRFEGSIYLSGIPAPRPRDWLLNLAAELHFVFHLKQEVVADLPAVATVITDPGERRRVLTQFVEEFNERNGPESPWPRARARRVGGPEPLGPGRLSRNGPVSARARRADPRDPGASFDDRVRHRAPADNRGGATSQQAHLAEGVGFEPTVPMRTQRFSRPSDSATLASLRRRVTCPEMPTSAVRRRTVTPVAGWRRTVSSAPPRLEHARH